MNPFQQFVEENIRWFRGHLHETNETLNMAEEQLGIRFPDDIRWLLTTHGYWYATGFPSLEGTIHDTMEARRHLKLPERYVVLENNGYETYAELLDTIPNPETGMNHVHFVDWEWVCEDINSESIVFHSYLDYVRAILEKQSGNIAEENVDYDPRDFDYTRISPRKRHLTT